MSADNIKINGHEYKLAIEPVCDPYSYDGEQDKEFVAGWMEDSDVKTNLLSDIVYYDPANELLCQAALFTPPPEGELRLDDLPSAKVLFVDREGKREVSELKIDCPDEEIKDKIEDIAELAGVSEGDTITHHEYSLFADEIKRFGLAKKRLITVTIDADKEEKLELDVDVLPAPEKIAVRPAFKGKNGIEESNLAVLNAAVQEAMSAFPNLALAMFYEPKALHLFLMGSPSARELKFTPEVIETKLEGDTLVVEIAPMARPPAVSVDWSPEYKDHIYSLPAKEQEEAMNDLIDIRSRIFSSNNRQEMEYRLAKLHSDAAGGATRGAKSYILLVDRTEENGLLTIELGRVASPTQIAPVEGDFPPEDSELLNDLVRPALRAGVIDVDMLGQGMERIRDHYMKQGYKLKELKYKITQDRTLHVIVDLRRWDSIYTVEIMEPGASNEERKEAAKLIDDIMELYNGKFIRTEDVEAIKKKLGRGGLRPNIREIIATDPETKKTKAVFVTAKADKEYAVSLGGGGSTFGMMMSTSFEVANDGSGRTFGGGLSVGSRWPTGDFNDWWTRDMYLGAVNLFMTTPLDKNKSLTVSVYGWKKNYVDPSAGDGRAEEWVTGGGATYNQYFLNDSVVLSLGSNVEYINLERPIEGYNDLPVRLKLKEGLCYRKNSTHLCVANQTSLLKANYDKLTTNVSYTIPLSSEENMPFVVLRTGGGAMMGNSPLTEQFTQFDTSLPFMFSFADGSIHFGRYFGGAAVELAQMLTSWLAVKPMVVAVRTIGPYASVSAGSCLDVGPLEACVGYRYGLSRVSKGWEFALGTNDLFQIPIPNTLRMLFANTFLKDKFEY